jgi:DNA (cytosine-5)-methyltransferase 1
VTRIGSLFSGVGGLDEGVERATSGRVLWQVEISAFCRRVLNRHWPGVPKHEDVRSVGATCLAPVDVIVGGFPCNDLSPANHRGAGLAGPKSGLWSEFLRIIDELGPASVLVENSADAWREWVPAVRRDLWRAGFASVPIHVAATELGAPHDRRRVFVVAHADREGQSTLAVDAEVALVRALADARRSDWRQPPPRALGVADGLPDRMDRLRAAGNAVMPPMAWVAGRVLAETAGRVSAGVAKCS